MNNRYEVHTWTVFDGWANAWHTIDESGNEQLETFPSIAEAQAEINSFLNDISMEIESGERDPDEGYSRDDYLIFDTLKNRYVDITDRGEFRAQVYQQAEKIYCLPQDSIEDHILLADSRIDETMSETPNTVLPISHLFTPEEFVLWFGDRFGLTKREDFGPHKSAALMKKFQA